MEEQLYSTHDLFFISYCLITQPGIQVVKVTRNEQRPDVKEYWLRPFKTVLDLQYEFTSNAKKVDPQLLALRMQSLKFLPIEAELHKQNINKTQP